VLVPPLVGTAVWSAAELIGPRSRWRAIALGAAVLGAAAGALAPRPSYDDPMARLGAGAIVGAIAGYALCGGFWPRRP
jgi:hypothetical protein